DAVAVVRAAVHDPVQEYDLAVPLPHGDVDVFRMFQLIGQFGELVVVGGEEGLGPNPVVDVFRHGPGDADAVEGAGAAAYLVEHQQAAVGGRVEDVGRLDHLHHEGALAPDKVVGGAHPGEDAIHHTHFGPSRRDEAP